ncbi:MAG TPA: RDD family protein [Polyangia bacterium]
MGRVAGFWIRLVSDLLDAAILGVIGFVVARIFRGALLSLGERAVIFGAPITLAYTGLLQSSIGRGQTLGKRLFRLRVLRLDGQYLSLDRSLTRWAVMGIMSYGGAVAIALGSVLPFVKVQTMTAALGGTQLALVLGCVLLVPFHPLKRGLHDLLTGSIVIRGGRIPTDLIARLHNPRRDRILVFAAIAVAVIGTMASTLLSRHLPVALQPAARVMTSVADLGVQNPGVVEQFNHGPNGDSHSIVVSGYVPTNDDGTPRIPRADDQILTLVRDNMPLAGVDAIVISLRSGINLGIYSSYETTNRVERVGAK